jgi:hypothetical protein
MNRTERMGGDRRWPGVGLGMAFALLAVVLPACAGDGERGLELEGTLLHLPTPALQGSGEPNLFAADDGRVYMTWFDRLEEGGHALRMAWLDLADTPTGLAGGSASGAEEQGEAASNGAPTAAPTDDGLPEWSEVRTIVSGANFFVNWADFPSIHALPDGSLAAHWLVRSGPNTFDYDVHIGWSTDEGRTWAGPVTPHRDGTLSEHGFASLFPWHDGSLGAVWLDGREFVHSPDDRRMTLRFTTLRPAAGENGLDLEAGLGGDTLLDDRICDCCQTSAALTDEGPVVAYRDRTEGEIRDISLVRHDGEGWSEPISVHDDGWEIPACPVNGPMVAARGQDVVVAWFTAANDEPIVRAAFSRDGGRSFDPPIRVDDGDSAGRVAVVMETDGRAVVSWLERIDEGAEVRVRRIDPHGRRGPAITIAESSAARASGFPRMVRQGDALVFAWNDVEDTERVQVSVFVPAGR